MSSLIFGIAISAVLSTTSLLVVLFRVSPLTSPGIALTSFFIALFLSVSSLGTLAFWGLWKLLPIHAWDAGKQIAVALREGIFLSIATTGLVLLSALGVLTWWIGILLYVLFILVELALNG